MLRTAAVLIAAMHLSRPQMPKPEADRYAKALNEAASKYKFDPLLAVAIVHFETQWHPTLVSPDGEDFGLGQVRARYLSACRNDADPLNAPSEACLQAKEALRDGVTNLNRMGSIIGANIEFCKRHTKSDAPERWLAGYQGYGDSEKGQFCQPGEKTHRVIAYYKNLVDTFAPAPKPKSSKTKTQKLKKNSKDIKSAEALPKKPKESKDGHKSAPKTKPPASTQKQPIASAKKPISRGR